MSTELKLWWYKVKLFCKKNPNLVSLASFLLFFLSLSYYFQMPWSLALVISLSLAVHEYAHVGAMRLVKIPIKGVIFIPFLGAVAIGGGNKIWSSWQECFIALAGPVAGYLSVIPIFFLGSFLNAEKIAVDGSFIVIIINLFNMIPLSPLDGGRVIKTILMSFKNRMVGFVIWFIVLGASVLFLFRFVGSMRFIFIFALIVLAAYGEVRREWMLYKENRRQRAPLSRKAMFVFGAIYIVLCAWPFVVGYLLPL